MSVAALIIILIFIGHVLIIGLSRDHTKVKRRRQPERQKVKGLVSKKETKEINSAQHVLVYHTFYNVYLPSLNNYDVKWDLWFSVSFGAWRWCPVFDLNLTGWTSWDDREKVSKYRKSIFLGCFHWCCCCQIMKSLATTPGANSSIYYISLEIHAIGWLVIMWPYKIQQFSALKVVFCLFFFLWLYNIQQNNTISVQITH